MMKTKFLLMLLAVGLMAGAAQANMLKNPSFEEGTFEANDPPAYWVDSFTGRTSNMTWFDDAADAHSGSKYIKMNSFWSYSGSAYCWQTVNVIPDQEYAFGAWAKCSVAGETSEAWGYYDWLDGAGEVISEGRLPRGWDVGNNWTYAEFGTVTAPALATQVQFSLVGALENSAKGVLFDDAYMDTPLPSFPSPAWESLVPVGDVELSWTNLVAPNDPNAPVYVDVWFGIGTGTEPNELDPNAVWVYDMEPLTLDPISGQDVTLATANALDPNTYYWRVDSYLYGDPATVGYDINGTDPNLYPIIKGLAWSFDVVADAPPSSVDAGVDMITWTDEPVALDATVVDDGESALTIAWSSENPAGTDVLFSATDVEDPTVTIGKAPHAAAEIVNASFEVPLATGWGDQVGTWNGTWAGNYGGKSYITPTDGDWCAYVMGIYGDPIEGAWISQTLTETLTVDTDYTLTVDVVNDGYYGEEVEYKVQLLAGEVVIAEDNNEWPLPLGPGGKASDWQISTVVYTLSSPSDPNYVHVGQPLGIRLVAPYTTSEISFDNVQLTADPPFPPPGLSTVELTVVVVDEANPTYVLKDSMTIDIYDDDCAAAKGAGLSADNPGDFDEDCDTDLADLAAIAEKWLSDTSLTGAVAKQTNQTPPPPAGLIDNPGFEVPDTTGFNGSHNAAYWFQEAYAADFVAEAVWTFTGGSGFAHPPSPWECDSTSPDPLGNQFAFMQGAASISQDLTGLTISEAYALSFYESYRTAMLSGNDLSVILDEGLGTEVTIYNNPGVTNTTWEPRQTDQFTAAKDSYTLTFKTTNPLGGDRSTLIDGVAVTNLYAPAVDAGDDMIALSGQAVQLAPTVVNNDPNEPQLPLTYAWSADPVDGVVFSATDIEAPTVTITKTTLDPSPVILTLAVNNEGSVGADVEDTLTIDLYNDACLAAKATDAVELDPTDLDANCITGLADFAEMAEDWLVDYTLTAPAPKP